MRSLYLFATLLFSGCVPVAALAQPDTRGALLIKRDFSDCLNSDVSPGDSPVGGYLTVDRGTDGSTHVRVSMSGRPNTTYHLFLKCVRLIGDVSTGDDGFAIANFDFPTSWAGDVFAFDMYPEGAPLGDKFQSVRVDFSERPPADSSSSFVPPDQQEVSRRVMIIPQASADCTNADLRPPNMFVSGGQATVDRGADGNTHVRVRLLADVGNTYHVALKCVRRLGDVTTAGQGEGVGNFDFRTAEVGDVFALEVFQEGTPDANKWQSLQIAFGDTPPPLGTTPRLNYVDQTARSVSFDYANMPANSEIVAVNWMSNSVIPTPPYVVSQAGDGSAGFTFPDGSLGRFYLLARVRNTGNYLAQTIDFYVHPPSGG